MKYTLALFTLLLVSCDPRKHDIEKGIEEMSEYREEAPVEDTAKVDCVFDTSYYSLTMEAIRGIPDAIDYRWDETRHMAIINWRDAEVQRKRGGCLHFADDLVLITQDSTPLADALHWLDRAQMVATHFGLPYFAQALVSRKVKLDPTMSDKDNVFYRLEIEIPEDRVLEGFSIRRDGSLTILTFEQYQS
jgi:hypothetical protein